MKTINLKCPYCGAMDDAVIELDDTSNRFLRFHNKCKDCKMWYAWSNQLGYEKNGSKAP